MDDVKLSNAIISLRKNGTSYKVIREKLKCAYSTISYHCRNAGLNAYDLRRPTDELIKQWQYDYDNGVRTIDIVNKYGWSKITVNKYLAKDKKVKKSVRERRADMVKHVTSWRKKIRLQLIEYAGGKCKVCGYNKCLHALEFHHINPEEKEFTIAAVSNSFDRMKREVNKCILLCANCHREVESGIIVVDKNGLVALEAEKS